MIRRAAVVKLAEKVYREPMAPLLGFFPTAGIFICRPPSTSSGLAVALNAEHHHHNG